MTELRSPGLTPIEVIHELTEGDPAKVFNRANCPAPPPAPKHPMAEQLFRDFRAGSRIMTKIEAYAIGNQLNALLAAQLELQREIARVRELEREDEPLQPARDREIEDAIDDDLARGVGKL